MNLLTPEYSIKPIILLRLRTHETTEEISQNFSFSLLGSNNTATTYRQLLSTGINFSIKQVASVSTTFVIQVSSTLSSILCNKVFALEFSY